MGMGVFFRGAPVRGPAGVADAIGAVERLEAYRFFQVAQFAFGAAKLKLVAVAGDSDSGGVIAAIFELSQALDDDWNDLLLTDITDNATHAETPGIQSSRE